MDIQIQIGTGTRGRGYVWEVEGSAGLRSGRFYGSVLHSHSAANGAPGVKSRQSLTYGFVTFFIHVHSHSECACIGFEREYGSMKSSMQVTAPDFSQRE